MNTKPIKEVQEEIVEGIIDYANQPLNFKTKTELIAIIEKQEEYITHLETCFSYEWGKDLEKSRNLSKQIEALKN